MAARWVWGVGGGVGGVVVVGGRGDIAGFTTAIATLKAMHGAHAETTQTALAAPDRFEALTSLEADFLQLAEAETAALGPGEVLRRAPRGSLWKTTYEICRTSDSNPRGFEPARVRAGDRTRYHWPPWLPCFPPDLFAAVLSGCVWVLAIRCCGRFASSCAGTLLLGVACTNRRWRSLCQGTPGLTLGLPWANRLTAPTPTPVDVFAAFASVISPVTDAVVEVRQLRRHFWTGTRFLVFRGRGGGGLQ